MSLKHLADNIAAHGRHGDDTLIHVDKSELAALKALAAKHGKPLTTNPETGLPEAFGLRQLLPIAAGFALGPAGVGMSAMGAGLTVGGVSALASGNLKQGMMDGLGAWGGAGLGAGVGASGTVPTTTTATTAGTTAGTTAATTAGTTGTAALPEVATTAGYTPQLASGTPLSEVGGLNAAGTAGTAGSQIPGGTLAENFAWDPLTRTNIPIPDTAGINELAVHAGEGAAANNAAYTAANAGTNAATGASTVPGSSSLNYVNGADLGGSAVNTGVSGKSTFAQIAANAEANPKYLAAALAPAVMDELTPKPKEQPKSQADADMGQRWEYQPSSQYAAPRYVPISNEAARKRYGYAEGGDVQYPYSEPVVRMYGGGNAGDQVNPGLEALAPPHLKAALRGSVLKAKGPEEEPVVRMTKGGEAGKHQAIIDSFNRDYGAFRGAALGASAPFVDGKVGGAQQEPTQQYAYHPDDQSYTNMAGGGLSSLGGYSDGGRLLKGPGDGMSDNIPAQIGQKQPARLADGEFVVPADVVSHLGNGSTDAGAKQLYKMMDRIRAARTGNKRQGKQINPNKFTPA